MFQSRMENLKAWMIAEIDIIQFTFICSVPSSDLVQETTHPVLSFWLFECTVYIQSNKISIDLCAGLKNISRSVDKEYNS